MVNKQLTGPPSLPDLRSVSPLHDGKISVTRKTVLPKMRLDGTGDQF